MTTRKVTSKSLYQKNASPLIVTTRELSPEENIACGFRQMMCELKDPEGNELGGVTSGAGMGNDHIILQWKGRALLIRGSELLLAWVRTFDQEGATNLFDAIPSASPILKVEIVAVDKEE